MILTRLAVMLGMHGGTIMPSENAFHHSESIPPMPRSGHTGIPAARRAKRKQKNIAAKR